MSSASDRSIKKLYKLINNRLEIKIIADLSHFKLTLKTEMKNLLKPEMYFYYGKINVRRYLQIIFEFRRTFFLYIVLIW